MRVRRVGPAVRRSAARQHAARGAAAAALAFPVLAAWAGAAPLAAQQGGSCEVIEMREFNQVRRSTPQAPDLTFLRGPVLLHCTGGVTIRADSAVIMEWLARGSEMNLIGSARYGDALKTLDADRINYRSQEAVLDAQGNVVFTDRATGSVILGESMTYLRPAPGRPRSLALIQGRPRARMYPRPPAGAAPQVDREPVHVVSDRMVVEGDTAFRAEGRVELQRLDMRGWADEAVFDEGQDRMELRRNARLETDEYQLFGNRIRADMAGDHLRELLAEQDAALLGQELRLYAPELRMFFADGEVERLVARSGAAAGSAPQAGQAGEAGERGVARPTAIAEGYRMIADSIDARAPAQRLETIFAAGEAYVETSVDSIRPEVPELLRRDWARGDTIIGHFAEAPQAAPGAGENPGSGRVLRQLVTIGSEGNRARSLVRMREEEGASAEAAGAYYLIARRITVDFEGGEVAALDAEGPVRGVHIQPDGAQTPAQPPRSAQAGRSRR
jgi:lipopolysaccharide export system protein LptA